MDSIYHVVELDDDKANSRANELLEKGWKLLHVGAKFDQDYDGRVICGNTVYVLGGTEEQFEQYKKEQDNPFAKF